MLSAVAPSASTQQSDLLAHSVWRASQMGAYRTPVIPSGHIALDKELPHGGWPCSVLIELLLQQPGIGEMRLLQPALRAIARERHIALVQPPYTPHISAWTCWKLAAEQLLWVRTTRSADALWSAEQILRNGSCGALLLWQTHIRPEALRRLHLAAQAADTVFWLMRPMAAMQDASPSPLRLALKPAQAGALVQFVKRRGPVREDTLFVPLKSIAATPFNISSVKHASVDQPTPAAASSRILASMLV